jgi:hypothetical protein
MLINRRFWSFLLLVFIVLDTALTFWQNYQFPLDGDLVGVVFPSEWHSKVLQDPFGWAVLTKNESYAGTNRFFAHSTMWVYWRQVPHLLQRIVTPIDSLYVASALFNTITQTLLVLLLAAYVRVGAGAPRGSWGYWLGVALLVPLFQTTGFYEQMGITNWAITYTSFYAFPTILLLLLLWPFYKAASQQYPLSVQWWQACLLVLLMVLIAFNGPLPIASVAVLLIGIGGYWLWKQARSTSRWPSAGTLAIGWLSGQAIGLLFVLAMLSAYSLYIGRNNAENTHTHTLAELYQLLPTGFWQELTMQWGLPALILLVIVNAQLIRHAVPTSLHSQRVLVILRWVSWFAVVFIMLLPFGGYRPYRPYLIRGDSIMPVLLGLFFAYGVSTYFLLFQLRGWTRNVYTAVLVCFLAFFIYNDTTLKLPSNNDCERWALDEMSRTPDAVVRVSPYCNILSWGLIYDPKDSELNAGMLHYWGITKVKKPYYQ